MGKFDGLLLVSDFDNTLVYTEEALQKCVDMPPVSDKNRAALEYFMAGGGRFAIATGRALAAFQVLAPDLPINTPCVICNGAALYDFAQGEYLDFNLLDETALRRGQALLDAYDGAMAWCRENGLVSAGALPSVHMTALPEAWFAPADGFTRRDVYAAFRMERL